MFNEELRGYVDHPQQLFMLRRVELTEGKAKGVSVIEVATADGLTADILPDTGLDIGQVRYKGVNMTFISKNGYDSPAANLPYELEFVNTFPGGLLYTCGLRSTGGPNRDNGEWHPQHGRFHGIPAEHVSTDVEGDTLVIRGTIRETALFGHNLVVKRTIRILAFGASITVHDEITNETPKDEEIMVIYHCNFGYPMLSEEAKLHLPKERKTTPRTDFAATGLGKEETFVKPVDGEEERVFFHEEMEPAVWLENPSLGIRMNMKWDNTNLPILGQWRCMASGDYVLGLEPTNSYIMGRHDERENGTLPVLKAYETIENEVTFTFSTIK